MKKLMIFTGLIAGLYLSCNQQDDCAPWCEALKSGRWEVEYFFGDGIDQTRALEGYKLTFVDPHTVTAIGVNFFAGYWEVRNDGSRISLFIDFKEAVPVYRLDNTWEVTEYDNSHINMQHTGNSEAGTFYFNLKKI